MARTTASTASRNAWFDLFRILFATLVLLAHAPEMIDGTRSRELFVRLTHTDLTLGQLAVDGFFLLSGFLIVRSWLYDPDLPGFLLKRLLRIVPGLAVAYCLSVFFVGLLAPGVPNFFHQFHLPFSGHMIPPVLPGFSYPSVNGSLWTIAYELRCYFVVAVLGLLGAFRRPALWLILTSCLMALLASPALVHSAESHQLLILGPATSFFPLAAIFFLGGCFYLYEQKIPFHPSLALAAILGISASIFFHRFTEPAIVLLGGYLLFYLSQHGSELPTWTQSLPDLSYGVYLYGWPVEALWTWYFKGSPWITFLVSVPICFALAALSWRFVERPMLQLKYRSSSSRSKDDTYSKPRGGSPSLQPHSPAGYRQSA